MPDTQRVILVLLVASLILLSIILAIIVYFNPGIRIDSRPTTLLLSPIITPVAGSTFTVSGQLVDDAAGRINGRSITFQGTVANSLPSSVTTTSINITDPEGVVISYCPSPTCTPDDGFSIGNKILRLHEGASIDIPTADISGAIDIRQVKITIQGMGNTPFTVNVLETGGTSFTTGSAGNSLDLVYFSIVSLIGIERIEIVDIGAGENTVGISMLKTLDPASSPSLIHRIDFEDLAADTYQSPLIVGAGTFFAIGEAPPATETFTIKAAFAGDAFYSASESAMQSLSMLDSTLGILGETQAQIQLDYGTGVTTIDCSLNDPDRDGDGICDDWELNGVPYTDASGTPLRYSLCYPYSHESCPDWNSDGVSEAPNPDRKDIYVEIDYMEHHEPTIDILNSVIEAFKDAPVENPDPIVGTGIALHILKDERITPHFDLLQVWTDPETEEPESEPDDFHDLKAARFGTAEERADPGDAAKRIWAKKQIFHYGLFVHTIGKNEVTDCGPSGLAETPGNDFIVSLGCGFGNTNVAGHVGSNPEGIAYSVGTVNQIKGTLMHELGHNLGLNHGGPLTDGGNPVPSGHYTDNCKPNYPSVMSYSRQFPTYFNQNGKPWSLDYSNQTLGALNENSLNEPAGLQGQYMADLPYGTPDMTPAVRFGSTFVTGTNPIDWDGSGTAAESQATMNVNKLGIKGCNSAGMSSSLRGYNDWANIDFNFRPADGGEIDGIYPDPRSEPPEANFEVIAQMEAQSSQCVSLATIVADAGDLIAIKFPLADSNGNPITNAKITMRIAEIGNGTIGPDMDPLTNNDDDLFTFDANADRYVIDWDTAGMSDGMYALKFYLAYDTANQSLLDCDGDGMTTEAKLNP